MKEEVVSRGIVLRVMPYKENDSILTVYFRDYGKLSVIAAGVRKPKSKNASGCQPLMLSEFTLFLRQGLCRLVRAVPINSYRYLQANISSQACATFICEYYYRGLAENEPDLAYYDYLLEVLEKLNQGYPPLIVYLFCIAFILKDSGSAMMVDHCVHCKDQRHIVSINVRDGGFLCLNHVHEKDRYYPSDVLRLIRYVNRLEITEMDQVDADEATILEAKRVMENFLDEYCTIQFSSQKFIG